MVPKIPFFRNLKDETHCLQACMKMILKYYFPKKTFTFSQLDKEMKIKGKNTYTTFPQALVVMDSLGLECRYFTMTRHGYENFLKSGIKEYYRQTSEQSPNVIESVDFHFSKTAWDRGLIKEKAINMTDIKEMLDKNCLVLAMIDYNGLKDSRPYDGHVVLIKSIDKGSIIINDPGPPAIEDRVLSKDDFLKIWHDSDSYRSALVVIRKK